MLVDVWHDTDNTFGMIPKPNRWPDSRFQHVARVDTGERTLEQSLEWAFRSTNSVDSHWSENGYVTTFCPQSRSSSVGDIFVVGNEFWYCEAVGFVKLNVQIKATG